MTGSLFGIVGERGFQRGMFFAGFSGSLSGGVVEAQGDGSGCPGHCYTSLNALNEITLSAGVVFWDRFLFYMGGGPNFAIMRSGQTQFGLHTEVVSGEHATAGIKLAVDDGWSFLAQVERVRLGDLDYNTPFGTLGVNVHDFWLGSLGFEYRFGASSPMSKSDIPSDQSLPVH